MPTIQDIKRFAAEVTNMPGEQMEAVASAWHDLPEWMRDAARASIRRNTTGPEWDPLWEASVAVRSRAARAARLAGLHDWEFSFAAWDAALAIAARDVIDAQQVQLLLSPFSSARRVLARSGIAS